MSESVRLSRSRNLLRQCFSLVSPVVLSLLYIWQSVAYGAGDNIDLININGAPLKGWNQVKIHGYTEYSVLENSNGKTINGHTDHTASAMVLKKKVSIEDNEWLSWRWKVKEHYDGLDERRLENFDFPLRISVVVSTGIGFWNSVSVNYAVASGRPLGEVFKHPKNQRAVHVVVGNKTHIPGNWHESRVNIRDDFKRLFGMDIIKFDAVSLLVDGDNSGQTGITWIGDLRLTTF